MRDFRTIVWVGAAGAAFLAFYVACASDEGSNPGPSGGSGGVAGGAGAAGSGGSAGGGAGGSAGASAGAAGSAGAGASAGAAGSAGMGATGGAAGSGGVAGSGGAAGTSGAAGQAGTAGSGGNPTAGDHILISEIGILNDAAEFIEIWNPTSQEVDLSDYYVADNSAYYKITNGPWNPTQTAGTDFLVRFPPGTKIPADGVIVIGANPTGFESAFGSCPTLFLNTNAAPVLCGGNNVDAMAIPPNGSLGDQFGKLLSNSREMVVLFTWDGSASTVKDVDYVTWGSDFDDNSRADKTGVAGYQPDTARASQKPASTGFVADGGAPDGGGSNLSIERCAIEPGEKLSGGNGLTGHDETSEDLTTSFVATQNPTPGAKSVCLP